MQESKHATSDTARSNATQGSDLISSKKQRPPRPSLPNAAIMRQSVSFDSALTTNEESRRCSDTNVKPVKLNNLDDRLRRIEENLERHPESTDTSAPNDVYCEIGDPTYSVVQKNPAHQEASVPDTKEQSDVKKPKKKGLPTLRLMLSKIGLIIPASNEKKGSHFLVSTNEISGRTSAGSSPIVSKRGGLAENNYVIESSEDEGVLSEDEDDGIEALEVVSRTIDARVTQLEIDVSAERDKLSLLREDVTWIYRLLELEKKQQPASQQQPQSELIDELPSFT